MPKILTTADAAERGVESRSRLMENGEYRDSLTMGGKYGIGYVLTTMSADSGGGWQNAHFHRCTLETYIVQKGWIAIARPFFGAEPTIWVLREGGVFTILSGHSHNVYVPAGAVFHTVRHGEVTGEKDWFPNEELDRLSKLLTEGRILSFECRG